MRFSWTSILLVAVGCGGGGGGGGGVGGGLVSQMVGPAGGTVTVTSGPATGASVVIPAGALPALQTITIASGTLVATGGLPLGPAVVFGPAGAQFGVPVTVRVPFDVGALPAGTSAADVQVAQRDDGTGAVTVLGSPSVSGGVASVSVDSFSTFQVFFPLLPPAFDATGTWVVKSKNGFSDPPGGDPDLTVQVTVTQNGNSVTVDAGFAQYTGTVSGNAYSVSAVYNEDGGQTSETIAFTLASANQGAGTASYSFIAPGEGETGGSDLMLMRVVAPTFDGTGDWDVTISNNFSDPPGNEDDDETVLVPVAQAGGTVEITTDEGVQTGFVSGADYVVNYSFPDDGGVTEVMMEFTLTSATMGTGTIRWIFEDDTETITGGGDLTLVKRP